MLQKFNKVKKWIEELPIIKKNTLVYASIFILIVGFMINGCALLIGEKISTVFYRIIDIFLLVVEGGIIGTTLLTIWIRRPKKITIIYSIFIGIFLINYALFAQNRDAIQSVISKFFLYNVTAFVLFYVVKKDEKLLKFCIKCAKWLFLFSVLYLFLAGEEGQYNVWLAKHFFIVSIFMIYSFLKYHTKHTFLISILCLIALIYTGSRTYLMLYFIFTIICVLIATIKSFLKAKIIGKIIITIVIIFIILTGIWGLQNYKTISEDLFIYFLKEHNIRIRMLRLFYSEDLFTSSAREDSIYPTIIEEIKENWLLGSGICGDRIALYQKYLEEGKIKEGYKVTAYYSHNLILEIYCTFGVIISSFLLLTLLYLYYRNFRYQPKKRDAIICLTMISIFPLMLNGTFLDNIFFWGLIGILMPVAKGKHAKIKEL